MNLLAVVSEHLYVLKSILEELEILLGNHVVKDKLIETMGTLKTALDDAPAA